MFWSRRKTRDAAYALYQKAVAQARHPVFYTRAGVPDTLDGRFDMIALHVFLILHRLKQEKRNRRLSQALFDLMFADMDQSLREMGVGDLGVGRRVKTMAKAMYGRISAYEAALEQPSDTALRDALVRNVFRGETADSAGPDWLAAYLRRQIEDLSRQPVDAFRGGAADFAPAESH